MILIVLFVLVPFIASFLVQYAICRFTLRKWWRPLPCALILVATALSGLGRYHLWTNQENAPWTQLIFFPVLPAFFALLGLLAGWRLWCYRWKPRVIREKKK